MLNDNAIATMLGVAGGAEPEFAISYKRRTDNLNAEYDVYCNEAKYYLNKFDTKVLPEYFVCSSYIHWKDRIDMQSAMQKHIDTAISSTVNLPKSTSIEDIEKLYLYAWQKKLKGITIFRDGCKRAGILTTEEPKEQTTEKVNTKSNNTLGRGFIIQTNSDAIGKKRKLMTGCGSLHVMAFFDPETGDLLETYFSKGSTGGCSNSYTGLSRMISLAARAGVDIDSIIDQLDSCGVCPSYAVRSATKRDTSKGACCPIAIGNALRDMYNEVQNEIGFGDDGGVYETKQIVTKVKTNNKNEVKPTFDAPKAKCPECGEELIFEGGCNFCRGCGFSKCD